MAVSLVCLASWSNVADQSPMSPPPEGGPLSLDRRARRFRGHRRAPGTTCRNRAVSGCRRDVASWEGTMSGRHPSTTTAAAGTIRGRDRLPGASARRVFRRRARVPTERLPHLPRCPSPMRRHEVPTIPTLCVPRRSASCRASARSSQLRIIRSPEVVSCCEVALPVAGEAIVSTAPRSIREGLLLFDVVHDTRRSPEAGRAGWRARRRDQRGSVRLES